MNLYYCRLYLLEYCLEECLFLIFPLVMHGKPMSKMLIQPFQVILHLLLFSSMSS